MAQTVLDAHKKIEEYSEINATDKVRNVPKMKIGQAVRQGDVYITAIKNVPENYTKSDMPAQLQLVPGSTQGSRHIIESTSGISLYKFDGTSELQGPVLEAKAAFTVTHPEHAHVFLQPGLYHVTFQKDWAEEERRVKD